MGIFHLAYMAGLDSLFCVQWSTLSKMEWVILSMVYTFWELDPSRHYWLLSCGYEWTDHIQHEIRAHAPHRFLLCQNKGKKSFHLDTAMKTHPHNYPIVCTKEHHTEIWKRIAFLGTVSKQTKFESVSIWYHLVVVVALFEVVSFSIGLGS